MGYARHVGRVGALAVALGVGMAVASTGGVAYAEPSGDSSSSSGDSSGPSSASSPEPSASEPSSSTSSAASTTGATGSDTAEDDDDGDSDAAAPKTAAGSTTITGSIGSTDTGTGAADDETSAPDTDETLAVEEIPEEEIAEPTGGGSDPTTAPVVEAAAAKNDSPQNGGAPGTPPVASRSAGTPDADDADAKTDTDTASQAQALSIASAPSPSSDAVFSSVATALSSLAPAPAAQNPPTLIGVVTEFVSAVLQSFLSPLQNGPFQIPFFTAALSLVRNEFEKFLNPSRSIAQQQSNSLVTSLQALPLEDQKVLVIGIDGTNLSRILALPAGQNANFLKLLGTSTSAAPSIVGHTTISNPSWTSILTGAWGERTGVINNVFTPWTYNNFPTMFDQIEALDEDIDTTVIADWNVINAIGAAGAGGADNNLYVGQIAGDTNWLDTDDLVAQLTVDSIDAQGSNPSLLFSYFVSVDENGHMYGGDSPEYQAALVNMDQNLGLMMDAVAAREDDTGEDWTIMVVTDHGHQPQKGFGHGFNSPDETGTFVIVDGPGFADSNINPAYQIVDTTPTVLQIFGGGVRPRTDGVPLQSLGSGTHYGNINDLVAGLNAEIAQNKSPNFITDTALTLRTIFATIPYYIYDFGLTGNSGLPSFLALPAQLLFSGLYIATNIPAQIVAFGTGVYGARLFPILPPPAPNFTPVNPAPIPLAPALIAV